jgi:2-polyprenyl-3-methyl-5-hydroxy-6-metoxy-1,4-benzoquinol methylase
LDLGCATGWQARHLVQQGCQVVGVEVDAEAAEMASAWCERVIVCDLDIADLPTELGADRFDVVAAGDLLEHLRDPARVLRSVRRLLRPTGRVVASIPNVAHGSVRLALLTGAFPYEDAGLLDRTHLRFFTLSSITELFETSGFTIDELVRIEAPLEAGPAYDASLLPRGIRRAVARMPEATTFQFVVVARPADDSDADGAAD